MDAALLTSDFQDLLNARSPEDIAREADRFRVRQGFDRYGLLVKRDDFVDPTSGVLLFGCCNHAETFADADPEALGKRDPVMQHLKRYSCPIVYDQSTYTSAGMGHVWEYQAPLGFAFGIATILHLPNHMHVLFGIDLACQPSIPRSELTRLIAETQLFAVLIQEAALDVARPAGQATNSRVRLGPRELECLKWAANGKTAWETGVILSIAEGSVAKIIASAIRKLNCASKPQAVVKALRAGLLD